MAESESATTKANRLFSAARGLRWLLLGLGVAGVIVAVLRPSSVVSWLRSDYYPWIGRPLNWLDDASTPQLDLTHVAMFGAISLLVACLWPRVHAWRIALWLLVLAVATEVVQFWVPGREPMLSDVYDNLLGIALGLAVATPVRWLRYRK
mgnify:CR=1 FL=1